MSILYIDAFSGISGDKTVAALLDLSDNFNFLETELKKLHIHDEYKISLETKIVNGISSKYFNVEINNHDLQDHHHDHRNLNDINQIIEQSSITNRAKEISKGIFLIIANAEAKVHNKPLNEVHFHEVGATDSIIDIVSVGILVDKLNITEIKSNKIPLGNGFVNFNDEVYITKKHI